MGYKRGQYQAYIGEKLSSRVAPLELLCVRFILTMAVLALVSKMAKGCILVRVLPLRCFLLLLAKYTNILVCFFYLHYLMMSLKYSFLNTLKQQYVMLLTSPG